MQEIYTKPKLNIVLMELEDVVTSSKTELPPDNLNLLLDEDDAF